MEVSWDIRLILTSTLAHRGDDRDTKSRWPKSDDRARYQNTVTL